MIYNKEIYEEHLKNRKLGLEVKESENSLEDVIAEGRLFYGYVYV